MSRTPVQAKLHELERTHAPSDVHMTITRNYGDTATEKSNELLFHMLLAVISVVILIAFALGMRGVHRGGAGRAGDAGTHHAGFLSCFTIR